MVMDRKDNLYRCLVHRVGDLSLHSLFEEVEPAGPLEESFPDARSEDYTPHLDWLSPAAYDRNLGQTILPVQSYLVRTFHHNVLIDTCIGNCKQAPGMPNWHQRQDYRLPQMLSDSGVAPEQVDYVLCTHLHLDHVGWNTKQQDGRWVPTFPNARYLFHRTEFAYSERCAAQGDPIYEESVVPILEAGLADLVDTDHTLDDEMWLEPLPGHRPGKYGVCFASRGERAVMVGDAIHNPIQLAFPILTAWGYADAPMAVI